MKNIIIGVDGGGTKTKACAYDIVEKRIVGEAVSNGLNRNSVTIAQIQAALEDVFVGLNIPFDKVLAVAVGDPSADDDRSDGEIVRLLKNMRLFDQDTRYFCCGDAFLPCTLSHADTRAQ